MKSLLMRWGLPLVALMLATTSMALAGAVCQPSTPEASTTAPSTAPTTPAPATQGSASAKPINTKCPVSGGDVDPSITVVYEGKVIGFCCSDCIEDFNKNPKKYMANLK